MKMKWGQEQRGEQKKYCSPNETVEGVCFEVKAISLGQPDEWQRTVVLIRHTSLSTIRRMTVTREFNEQRQMSVPGKDVVVRCTVMVSPHQA